MGAVSLGVDRGFNPTTNQPRFGGELAPIVGRSGHDRTAIMSHDLESGLIAAARFDQVGWAVPIAKSSCVLMPFRRPFDEDQTLQRAPCVAKVRGRSRSIVAV